MSEQTQINEERLKKFQNMGIPMPVVPIDPSSVKNLNADPEKLKKLNAIRSGALKNDFKAIVTKAEPTAVFNALPNPKQKRNPNAPKSESVAPIKSFAADSSSSSEARLLENALYGDTDTVISPTQHSASREQIIRDMGANTSQVSSPRIIEENTNDDEYGTNFINNFRSRIKTVAPGISPSSTQSSNRIPGAGIQIVQPISSQRVQATNEISEAELENKIISIATSVSKDMIKKVISEYAKDGSGIIIESKNVKKAQLVGNGIVKISGKTYKLVPIKENA